MVSLQSCLEFTTQDANDDYAKPSQLARLSSGKLKKTCKIGQFLSFKKENIEDIYFSYFGTRLPTKAMSIRVQLQCVLSFEFALSLSLCMKCQSRYLLSAHRFSLTHKDEQTWWSEYFFAKVNNNEVDKLVDQIFLPSTFTEDTLGSLCKTLWWFPANWR